MVTKIESVEIKFPLSAVGQPVNEFNPTADESTSWLSRPNIFVAISKVFQMSKDVARQICCLLLFVICFGQL